MADWTIALLDAAGAAKAKLIGHSMGSLIALEAAARHPARVSELCLIATSDAMAVSADLLGAAERNEHDAIDMVSIWGLGFPAEIGGSLAPGVWMHGGAQRTLEAARPGVLHADLAACNAYRNAATAARSANIPVTLDPRRTRHDDVGEERPRVGRRVPGRPHRRAERRRPHADGGAARRGARGLPRCGLTR